MDVLDMATDNRRGKIVEYVAAPDFRNGLIDSLAQCADTLLSDNLLNYIRFVVKEEGGTLSGLGAICYRMGPDAIFRLMRGLLAHAVEEGVVVPCDLDHSAEQLICQVVGLACLRKLLTGAPISAQEIADRAARAVDTFIRTYGVVRPPAG